MFDIILKNYLSSSQILWGYYNAGTINIIVNTCTVCILESVKFQVKV